MGRRRSWSGAVYFTLTNNTRRQPDQVNPSNPRARNEFGHIIASKENGPLYLLYDSNRDRTPDLVKVYCDKVKNCQGILALNGDVFVTGEGPDARHYEINAPRI